MKVKVVKGPMPYGMKYYPKGAELDIPVESIAKLLIKSGAVVDATAVPKKRRVYRRRDAQAQERAVMVADSAE